MLGLSLGSLRVSTKTPSCCPVSSSDMVVGEVGKTTCCDAVEKECVAFACRNGGNSRKEDAAVVVL